MLLAIDVGNTQTHLGLFRDSGMLESWRFHTARTATADELAAALAGALLPDDGWYADFQSADEHVVVFAGRVFRYRRGDADARADVVAYGLSVGTPEHQLDRGE
jgi:hypothetical protein